MAVHKFRALPYDVSRCIGTNCTKKEGCARFLQLERDRSAPDRYARVVYTDSPRSGDDCQIYIGVEP